MSRLTVYGNIETSRTWWTAWMCAELGLEYDNESIDPDGEEVRGADYLALNPNGRVPTLKDGDATIWESLAINLYLAKKYGGDRYPDTLDGEALVWQWSFWAVSRVEAPLLTLFVGGRDCSPESEWGQYFLQHVPRWDADELARCRTVLREPFRVLDETLSENRYILGERFTVADLNVACIFSRLRPQSGIQISSTPNLSNWLRRCWSRETCPRGERLIEVLDG